MNGTKSKFLIQDLEILSGIKAHTIRIWEKRYNLFEPDRMNRNVRLYDLQSLQKILNISVLNQAGFKISAISKLSCEEIAAQAKETALDDISKNYLIHGVLLSMLSFDEEAFEKIYQEEIKKIGFEELFVTVYAPVMKHIGLLWQTNSIKPVHEHFLSNLLNQKITTHTHLLKPVKFTDKETIHVLFLCEGEMHQIGLLFLNYLMRSKGLRTLYLGSGIPTENLAELQNKFKKIIWVNRIVIDKTEKEKDRILQGIISLLEESQDVCWLIGEHWLSHQTEFDDKKGLEYFNDFECFAKKKGLLNCFV